MTTPIFIASYARTPMGGLMGDFADMAASQLGAAAIKAAMERAAIAPDCVDEAIMGCVLAAGQGQAPARQAALGAGLPQSVGCVTINKMCGSGLKAIMMGADQIKAGSANVVIAGGMESMSNAPYLLAKARGGYRMGHGAVLDHMFLDGLEDAYDKGKLMGVFAEATAAKYGFSREAQDEFAMVSLRRAQAAIASGAFKAEITPVTVKTRKGEVVIDTDEQPPKAQADKIPTLKPAFAKEGTVTAANASSISDGAAAVVLSGEGGFARIVGYTTHAHAPEWFSTAPVGAMQKLMQQTGWTLDSVDLFEVNEAFAVVTMAAMHDLKLPHEKVNVHGGACALGHPIGASGARIMCTLLSALVQRGGKRGVASLCIGGGEAVALAVEMV